MAFDIVVVGASMGGAAAIGKVLEGLPTDFGTPMAVVLHRSPDSSRGLVQMLQRCCALPIREPNDKEPIRSGYVYLAAPDYHLMIDGDAFALSTDAPVSYARPSIDVLFETAAESYYSRVIGIVLTGANADGARGATRIREAGGMVLIQEPQTAESPEMPRAAMLAAPGACVMQVAEMAAYVRGLTSPERKQRVESR